jgi:hypothetical protein
MKVIAKKAKQHKRTSASIEMPNQSFKQVSQVNNHVVHRYGVGEEVDLVDDTSHGDGDGRGRMTISCFVNWNPSSILAIRDHAVPSATQL